MEENKNNIPELIRDFTNGIAYQLNPSEDTKKAIRLFRHKLPELLENQKKTIRESIEETDYIRDMNVAQYRKQILELQSLSLTQEE